VSGITPAKAVLGEKDSLVSIFKRRGVELAFFFGSAVEQDPIIEPRDVDIAVYFSSYNFRRYLSLLHAISRTLRRKDIDLTVLNMTGPALRMEVLVKGDLIYCTNAEKFAHFSSTTFFDYEDYLYFKVQYLDCLRKRTREGLSVVERKLNRERIETYLSRMDESIQRLLELRARFSSYDNFMENLDTRELCVHHLRIALECVLDVCRHFLAVKGVSLSEIDTAGLIELAGQKGLFDYKFARRIKGMAGMRNAIVHVYWRLDYMAIYRAITKDLSDFNEFICQVNSYLEERGKR